MASNSPRVWWKVESNSKRQSAVSRLFSEGKLTGNKMAVKSTGCFAPFRLRGFLCCADVALHGVSIRNVEFLWILHTPHGVEWRETLVFIFPERSVLVQGSSTWHLYVRNPHANITTLCVCRGDATNFRQSAHVSRHCEILL